MFSAALRMSVAFPSKTAAESTFKKKTLDAIPTGIMFTPRQRCTDVQNNALADGACGMEPRASNAKERIVIMLIRSDAEWKRYEEERDAEWAIAQQEQRLRRLLRKRHLYLRKSRGERQKKIFGTYYITDAAGIMPILRSVSLEWVEEQVATRPWCF